MARTAARRSSTSDSAGEFPRDVATYVFHLFAVISRHREAQLDRLLQPLGLNLSRHRALAVIRNHGPLTMRGLADYTAIDRTTLTRIVDQLVEGGYVERATPREDRRQVVLTVTGQGESVCRASLQAIRRHNIKLLEAMDEPRQRALARTFEDLLGRLIEAPALLRTLMLRDEAEAGSAPSGSGVEGQRQE